MMVSQVLRRLESKGLVKRTADPIDARAKRVGLTRAGGTRLRKAMPTVNETDADFFSPVSRTLLVRVLTSLATTTEDDHEHDSDGFADLRGARAHEPTV
jgi:DNA-binding MarR family transcriptional regulator